MACNKNVCNNLISRQIASVAKEGYIVKTNLSTVDSGAAVSASKFCKSRTDLVVYHPKKLEACIVIQANPKPDKEEEEVLTQLTAGVSENKKDATTVAKGQLLGGMDKVAGEIAYLYITGDKEPSLFESIVIYELISDLQAKTCTVHKLIMDFNTHRSTLESSERALSLDEGLNRLLCVMGCI